MVISTGLRERMRGATERHARSTSFRQGVEVRVRDHHAQAGVSKC
jgi:hypothetical protein